MSSGVSCRQIRPKEFNADSQGKRILNFDYVSYERKKVSCDRAPVALPPRPTLHAVGGCPYFSHCSARLLCLQQAATLGGIDA